MDDQPPQRSGHTEVGASAGGRPIRPPSGRHALTSQAFERPISVAASPPDSRSSASSLLHADLSYRPTWLLIARNSAKGAPQRWAASATPTPSIASARARGRGSARFVARESVPVIV